MKLSTEFHACHLLAVTGVHVQTWGGANPRQPLPAWALPPMDTRHQHKPDRERKGDLCSGLEQQLFGCVLQ